LETICALSRQANEEGDENSPNERKRKGRGTATAFGREGKKALPKVGPEKGRRVRGRL